MGRHYEVESRTQGESEVDKLRRQLAEANLTHQQAIDEFLAAAERQAEVVAELRNEATAAQLRTAFAQPKPTDDEKG